MWKSMAYKVKEQKIETWHQIYKNLPKPWWSRKGPWKIKRLAIYTNMESKTWPPFGCRGFIANKGPLFKEWGAIYLELRFIKWIVNFRLSVGNKTSVIPKWMN